MTDENVNDNVRNSVNEALQYFGDLDGTTLLTITPDGIFH